MPLRIALIYLAAMLFVAGCETPSEIDLQDTDPAEKNQIEQIDDTIQGFQGDSVFFQLSEYYRSDSPIKTAEFYSDSVLVESMEEDTFQISQPEELFGEYVIESVVTNVDDQMLESTIIYMIEREKNPIEQIKDTIQGFQGNSVIFHLSEYYRSDSPIETAEFYSNSVSIEPMEDDSFQISQPKELNGEYIIESVVTNVDDQTLESTITYMIDPKENDTTDTDSPEPVPPSDGVMVIMPLGDSMTNDSRPRVTLWNLLTDDGHELDYVGDQHQTSSIPDPDHEGVGGIKIEGILEKAEDLMERHQPEYVLLMVGTNDIVWYFDETGQEIADRWNELIQLIFDSSDSDTYIIAATIPPASSKDVGKSNFEERDRAVLIKQFNKAVRAHINERLERGENIEAADMEEALDPNKHLADDGVHLNEEGYRIMGTVYYDAVNRVLSRQN